jgi:DNA-binding transcriptional LysR family regulator
MRYFLAVAEAGQLTRAARILNIAQPTLSQALAQLEDQLGVRLLERHARGVNLTDAGQAFLDKARSAVIAADEAAATARALTRSRSESLMIGFHFMPLTEWAPIFQQLAAERPGARLDWRPLGFPLADRSPIEDADVGLILEPPQRPGLSKLVLERDRLVGLMPATHPLAGREELTVADLLDETWPGCHPSMDRQWMGFWTFDERRGGPPKFTDDQIMTAEEGGEVVASGRAIVTSPARLAAAFPHPGIVAVPLVDAPQVELALVWRAEHQNPLVDALVDLARSATNGAPVH